jgi:phosphomannomutase
MEAEHIKFKNDGWRDVAGDTFTDANLIRVAHAFARYHAQRSGSGQKKIAVGFDGRRSSRQQAMLVAEVLSSHNAQVLLSNAIIPTAVLAFTVNENGCNAGVMISGGDLPADRCGITFKEADGRPVSVEEAGKIEACILAEAEKYAPQPSLIELSELIPAYIAHVRTLVDFDRLRTFAEDARNHAAVIIDSMGGAGQTLIEDLLVPCGWRAQTIFGAADPDFYDRTPKPVRVNLEPLTYNVNVTDTLFGLATDGDARRCGVVYEDGAMMEARDMFDALVWHYREHKGGHDVVAGDGEGGFVFRSHIPECDAILTGLLFAEMIAVSGRSLKDIVETLTANAVSMH